MTRLRGSLITTCVACLCCVWTAAPALAVVRFVDAARPDDSGDGLSWAAARRSLQTALADAQPGDEIWVAAGEYKPSTGLDRAASFFLRSGVAIYGGFAGDEASLDQRDILLNETVLCGDLAGDDLHDGSFTGSAENSYHVVVALDVDATAVLDGFTICCGRADGPGFGPVPKSQEQGSGLNVYDASPQIVNCTFRDNWSLNHGAVNDHGIASTFMMCMFEGNYSADFGAGLYIHHHSHTHAEGCLFANNVSAHTGAGVYCRSEHGAMIVDCTFLGNAAELGAGLYTDPDSVVNVMDCTFLENYAIVGGGGAYCDNSRTTFMGCTFARNAGGLGILGGGGGGGGSGGGGIWNSRGMPIVMNCTFVENEASFGAGLYNNEESRPDITDCVFSANTATEGAGLYNLNSVGAVLNCRFEGNVVAGGGLPVGGGMSNYFADMAIDGCWFVDNYAEFGGGGLYIEGGRPIVSRCRFLGNTAVGPGQGWGGGLLSSFATEPVIRECAFSGNRADVGGGMHNTVFSFAEISGCTFVHNTAGGRDGLFGGAFFNNQLEGVSIAGCILWGNTPDQLDGLALPVSWSDVQGGAAGVGNFSAEPLLADPLGPDLLAGTPDDDLHLTAASPCINAGDPDLIADPLAADLDDKSRIMGCRVDVGADEFALPQPVPGDFDRSGAVDAADAAPFVAALLSPTLADSCLADMNGDGVLGGTDIQPFVESLLAP